jgi:hypothetical protein
MPSLPTLFPRVLLVSFVLAAVCILPSCTQYAPPPPAGSVSRDAGSSYRPGLATHAEGERYDSVQRTAFYRKSAIPDAVDSFHYNDRAGAEAMAKLLGKSSERSGTFTAADGRLRLGLELGWHNNLLPHLDTDGRRIVIGSPGARYTIRLENRSDTRVEVVVSVDSLNVLTGSAASPSQRGIVIEPKCIARVRGFRINDDKVRPFSFGGVAGSAAATAGAARNVGVIGVAVFDEDVAKAKLVLRKEQFERGDAAAFPVSDR